MNKKISLGLLFAVMTTGLVYAAVNDPVVMSVNGKDVKLSEFKYLYTKNKQQQLEQQSFDEYVTMFSNYKRKVAAAEDAGIDTTFSFKREFNNYQNELAAPYLKDAEVENRLEKEAYDRMQQERNLSYIMFTEDKYGDRVMTLADSLYKCIKKGEDFNELAVKYSTDPAARQKNRGDMGWVAAAAGLPYAFEKVAYDTPKGDVCKPLDTSYGVFLIRVNDVRPAQGEVLCEHILKLIPKGASEAQKAKIKATMDSIRTVVVGGGDFEEIAKTESQDPGSKGRGGKLPWFCTGKMVPTFSEAAFALGKGEISPVIETSYGYHIIKKLDARPVEPFETAKKRISEQIQMDERAMMPRQAKVDELKKQYKYKANEKNLNALYKDLEKSAGLDSLFIATHLDSNKELATIGKEKITVGDEMKHLKQYGSQVYSTSFRQGKRVIGSRLNYDVSNKIIERAKSDLQTNNADYANLLNEYRDGLLLFEISNRNVWDKAAKDTEGLTALFESNRKKYTWASPKYKGFLIQAKNDTVAGLVRARLSEISTDTLVSALRKEFKRDIKVERVLVAQGENSLVDACEFTKTTTANPDDRYPVYFTYAGKIIAEPENMNDVRGQVVVDYQSILEKKWLEELQQKYPVTLYQKELEKAKN